MTRPDKHPTFVSLVRDALQRADDFLTVAQLRAMVPELTLKRAAASLVHLRKHKAADFMVADGATYWFLTGEDERSRTTEERVREPQGNRRPRTSRKSPEAPTGGAP